MRERCLTVHSAAHGPRSTLHGPRPTVASCQYIYLMPAEAKSQSGTTSMTSDGTQMVYFFGAGQAEGGSSIKDRVGGKGASLADMTVAGLNVPPGFTISSECCALYYEAGKH